MPINRGLTVHRAKIDSWTVDSFSDVKPMAMTLLVEDSGCSTPGEGKR